MANPALSGKAVAYEIRYEDKYFIIIDVLLINS